MLRHSAICDEAQGNVSMTVASRVASGSGFKVSALTSRLGRKAFSHLRKHGSNTVNVPCRPLPDLMAEAASVLGPEIDFLSLDVEGAEDLVLETGRPASRFKVVVIELDGRNPAKDERALMLLREANLTLGKHLRVAKSQVWVARGVVEHPVKGIRFPNAPVPSARQLEQALRQAEVCH